MSHLQNSLFNARKQLRNKIRRQEIQSYFQLRRTEALKQVSKNIELELEITQNEELRIVFLSQIKNALLSSQPNSQWQMIIDSLEEAIISFQNSLDLWLKYEIIDLLSLSMKLKYSNLNLQYKVAKLLAKTIIYYKNEQNFNYINHFFQSNYIEDFIIYQKSIIMPLNQSIQFLHFFSNLSAISEKIRKNLLQMGVGEIIISIGYAILQRPNQVSNQIFYNYLGYTTQFLRIFATKQKHIYPDLHFVLQIIPLLSQFIEVITNEKIINLCLNCFLLILRHKKTKIFQNILSIDSIVQKIFYFLKYKPHQQKALNIMSYLSYSDNHTTTKFISEMNFLDILFDINCQENSKNQVKRLTANILYNLISNEQESNYLIAHPLWKILCSHMTLTNISVKQEAIYCILNTINSINSKQTKKIVFAANNLVGLAVNQLVLCKQKNYHFSFLILQLLQRYILAYTQENSEQNRAVSILENIYKFNQLLESIFTNHKSEELADKASKLYDFINTTFIQNHI